MLCMVEEERLGEDAEPTCLFPWDELPMEGREADLVCAGEEFRTEERLCVLL